MGDPCPNRRTVAFAVVFWPGLLYCFLKKSVQIRTKLLTRNGKRVEAVGYLRTSSAANVGDGKDSEQRQRLAIERHARAANFVIVGWFYDAAVSGADPVEVRPGFAAMLARIAANSVRTIIVETANRFARDLMVQEVGFAMLRDLGVTLIAADSPASFLDDGPTSKLIRQILGAVAEFDKAMTVAKLKGARDRIRRGGKKCEGRKSYTERAPEMVILARAIKSRGGRVSLRKVSAELAAQGYTTPTGKPYSASAVQSMLA
jgi:DNA invertase Pin-like site-specific DNA recombinase